MCVYVTQGSNDDTQSMDIHYWIGNGSSQDEQGAAAIYVTQLDEYLGGSPVQHRDVQGYESAKFRGYFKQGIIYKKGGVASGFKHVESNVYNILRLLHVKGKKNVTATEVEVSWKSFNSGDVFLLDMGKSIVQWNGPQSNRGERLKGCLLAQDIRDRERGGRARIGVVEGDREEASSELIKMMISVLGQRTGSLRDAVPDDTPDQFQVSHVKLYQVSDTSGQLMVQEVASSPLTQDLLHSEFMTSANTLIHVVQGRHATQDEITACAYQAVNVDNRYNGAPVQVRVTMGKEPRHFLAIFKGRLIIYEGGTGKPGVVNPDPGARLFQVRGTNEINTKATEVPARASSLNSNDIFLLKTDLVTYTWYGKGCSGDEREMGKVVSDVLSKQDKQIVMEGQEPPQFWVALGGKGAYSSDKRFEREVALHSPRLFNCSNQVGQFRMTEVAQFTQDDLDEDDVMLLDTWDELFLWIGNSANQYETQESYRCAVEYLKTHPAKRDPETPVITVKQGYEPPTFTGWFNAWDSHKWSGGLSYEEMKSKLDDSGSVTQITMVCDPFSLSTD
uniref:Villin-like n=1 Tax=Astyanax mexicanus TaxID=7994 RepID=A0A8B9LXT9_ASTMX